MIQTKFLALKYFLEKSSFEPESFRPQDIEILLQLAPKKVDDHYVISNNAYEILCLLTRIDVKSKCGFPKITSYLLDFARGIFNLKVVSQYYYSKVTPRLELLEFDVINKVNLYLVELLTALRNKTPVSASIKEIVNEVYVPKFRKLVLQMSDYANPLEQNFEKNEILWLRSLLKLSLHNPLLRAFATQDIVSNLKEELNKMMKIPVVQQIHDGFYKTGVLVHLFRALDADMNTIQFVSSYTNMLIKRYLKFEEVNHKLLNPFRLALEVNVSYQERFDGYVSETNKALSLSKLLGTFLNDFQGVADNTYVRFINDILRSIETVFWRIPTTQEKVKVIEILFNFYMKSRLFSENVSQMIGDNRNAPVSANAIANGANTLNVANVASPAGLNNQATLTNNVNGEGSAIKYQPPEKKKEETLLRMNAISKMVLNYIFKILEQENFDAALLDFNNSVAYNFIVLVFNSLAVPGTKSSLMKSSEEDKIKGAIKDPRKLEVYGFKFLYSLVKRFHSTRINELIYNLISSRYSLKVSLNEMKYFSTALEEKKAQKLLVKMKLQMSLNIVDSKLFQKSMTELTSYYSEVMEDPKNRPLEEFTYSLFKKVIAKAPTEEKLVIIWNQLTSFMTRLSKEIIGQAKSEIYLAYFAKNLGCLKDLVAKGMTKKNTTLPRDPKFIERFIEIWIHIMLNKQTLLQLPDGIVQEIALLTPRLIQASATSYTNTFLINTFLNNSKVIDRYRRNMKHVLRDKIPELRPKIRNLSLGEMMFLISIDFILDVKIKEISKNPKKILEVKKDIPFIETIFCYVRDVYITEKENLKEVLEELLIRKARAYIGQLMLIPQEKLQMHFIERDFVTILQSSCSINRIYMRISQIFLKEFMREFPKLIFQDLVISSLCETIEFFYRKILYQYDSVSSRLKLSHYNLKIAIPNTLKELNDVLVFLLACLHSMCLRGYIIEGSALSRRASDLFALPQFKDVKHGVKIFKYVLWTLNNHTSLTSDITTKGPAYWLYDKAYFMTKVERFDNKHLEEGLKVISVVPLFSFEIHYDSKAVVNILLQTLKEFKAKDENHAELNALKEKNPNYHKIFCNLREGLIHYYVYYFMKHDKNFKPHLLELFKDPVIANAFDLESKEMIFSNDKKLPNLSEKIRLRMDEAYNNFLGGLHISVSFMRIYPEQAYQVLQKIYTLILCYPVRKIVKYVVKNFTKNILMSLPSKYTPSVLRALFSLFQESISNFNSFTNITAITKLQQGNFDVLEVNSELFNRIRFKDLYEAGTVYNDVQVNLDKFSVTCKERNDLRIKQIRSLFSIRHSISVFTSIHKDIMIFMHNHVSVFLANQIHPIELLIFLQESFEIIKTSIELLKSDNIFATMNAHLIVLNILKNYPTTIVQKRFLQKFHHNTLKFALNYFSKNTKYYVNDTYESESCVKKIEKKMELGLRACRYLKVETFMESGASLEKIENPIKFPPAFLDLNVVTPTKTKLLFKFQDSRSRWFYTSLNSKFIGLTGISRTKRNLAVIYDATNEKKQVVPTMGGFSKFQTLRKMLLALIGYEVDMIKAFNKTELGNLKYEFSMEDRIFADAEARTYLFHALELNPNLVIYLIKRMNFAFPVVLTTSPAYIKDIVSKYYLFNLQHQVTFDYFVEKNLQGSPALRNMFYWDTPQFSLLMKYMTLEYEAQKTLQVYFTKTMKRLESMQLLFYLPQIYQTLNTQASYIVAQTLKEYSQHSYLFSHQLIWKAKVESKHDKNEVANRKLASISCQLLYQLLKGFNSTEKFLFKEVDDFFESITAISGILDPKKMSKKRKEEIIKNELQKITVSQYLYVPCNPQYMISKIKLDSGRAMQSAAKCPILVSFYCKRFEGPDKYYQKLMNTNKPEIVEVADSADDVVMDQDEQPSINDLKVSSQIKLLPKESLSLNNSEQHIAAIDHKPLEKINEEDEISPRDVHLKFTKQIEDENNKLNLSDGKIIPKDMIKANPVEKKETFDFVDKRNPTNIDDEEEKDGLVGKDDHDGMRLEISYGTAHNLGGDDFTSSVKHRKSTKFLQNAKTGEKSLKESSTVADEEKKPEDPQEEKYETISCIFKVFDDIRQDDLALQVINLFKYIFQSVGLDLFLFPYRTISNRTGKDLDIGGIIEVVPNTISRDQMGKMMNCNLYEYFIARFGNELSPEFQLARENFIKSMAAYSIVSYILQIKDRHNGNILIDAYGHIVHIDFGFIFDISPAHNMKFESANFKLTKEMIQIMGGSQVTEPFNYFVDQTMKAFLAVRRFDEQIFNMVKLMTYSGLKCFRVNSLQNLKDRFMPKINDLQASTMMKKIILDAYDKLTTNIYDGIQHLQNKIHY